MATVTAGTLLPCVGGMIWIRYYKKRPQSSIARGVELASVGAPQVPTPPSLLVAISQPNLDPSQEQRPGSIARE